MPAEFDDMQLAPDSAVPPLPRASARTEIRTRARVWHVGGGWTCYQSVQDNSGCPRHICWPGGWDDTLRNMSVDV